MKRRTLQHRLRHRRAIAGFTLLEVLIVVVIIGILFAIAAPAWDALLSRQRITSARDQVLQNINRAQAEARTSRTPKVVAFDATADVPRIAIVPYGGTLPIPTANISNWVTLGEGSIPPNSIKLTTSDTNNQIAFDSNGAVGQVPAIAQNQTIPYTITITRAGTTNVGSNRCVIIQTLLGVSRLEEGDKCS